MDEQQKRLHELYELAEDIGTANGPLLGKDVGITILVHDAVLSPGTVIALYTTLPSRRHTRALIAQTLVGSAIADGADIETVTEMAQADLRALEQGELDKKPE